MAVKSKRQQELEMYGILIAMSVFFSAVLFAIFWIAKPQLLIDAYKAIRTIQFATLWDNLFPQARQLIAETDQEYYSIWTLMKSAIPTAVLAGIGVFTLGMMAHNKVTTEHLDAYITHKEPPSMMTMLGKFAIFKPAVRFVLDYKDYALSSIRGAGRLPYHPLNFLNENGFIKRIGKPSEWADANVNTDFPEPLPFAYLEVDKPGIQAFFARTFGPRNPFVDMPNMNDLDAVRKAVDELPFYMVLVMAPAIARVHYSIFYEEKAYVRAVLDLHKFPDEVWAELNAMKKAEGHRLRLGFDSDKHRASENSLWHENQAKGRGKKKGKKSEAAGSIDLVTLAEYLDETVTVDGKEARRGDVMKTVKKARDLMWDVLTTHRLEDRKRWPVAQDEKTRFVWKDAPPATAAERAYLDKVMERLVEAAEECTRLMKANAFCFGLMGTLVERTRQMGVYPPGVWRWMRFVEIHHWRFLLDLGKPISTVDSMGMWEHFKAEKAIGAPIHKPFLRRTSNDLSRQAARFVTKEFIAGYHRANVVDDTGASFNLDALYREIDRAEAQRQAEKNDLKSALNPSDALDFDPETVFAASDKPIAIKKSDRRIIH
ncbi:hypothetical protein [Paracoccus sp. TOH]|uniref:secretion/conjugation apparatus DotM-related subunit n=1 Tax=Paracoccus sp. TOH TaxID=1263728 RepID=UPI0025B276B7|nr:hypothetical protein [Paracoccus sp. TOH]WJS87266.1 hypothetical protein NBE95_20520 [Paracoccus sp. TOH]